MIKLRLLKCKMKWLYRLPQNSLYSHRFFNDFCSGYFFSMGYQNNKREFLTFEPSTSPLSNLYANNHHYYSHDLEHVINAAINSLLAYGRAFLHIKIEYNDSKTANKVAKRTISSIDLAEIKGFPIRDNGKILFCAKNYSENVQILKFDRNTLVKLDLKDIGFRRAYFRKILKRLQKLDLTVTTNLLSDSTSGYDFPLHDKRNRLRILKITKDIGWSFGSDELSDSNILYRKIQMDKLKLRLLMYVVESVNTKLSECMGKNSGELVAHVKQYDYDRLWSEYSRGDLTFHQLSGILFSPQQ